MVVHAQDLTLNAKQAIQWTLTVPQLKTVLRQFGLSTTGRKADLQTRLEAFLDNAVRQSYDRRVMEIYTSVMTEAGARSTLPARSRSAQTPSEDYSRTIFRATDPTYTDALNTIRASVSKGSSYISQKPPADLYFSNSPFYDLGPILHTPIVIYPPLPEKLIRSAAFSLSEEQAAQVQSGQRVVFFMSQQYDESTDKKAVYFPLYTELTVNSESLPTSVTRGIKGKQGSTPPPDITAHVKRVISSPYMRHQNVDIAIQLASKDTIKGGEDPRKMTLAMAAFLATPHSLEEIIEQIKARPRISKEAAKALILESNQDEDIVATNMIHSIKDPVSFSRIQVPIRSVMCQHIDCLDARTFLQLQQQAPTWTCQVCNKALKYEDLAVDEFMEQILYELPPGAEEIEVLPDGSWRHHGDVDMSDSDSDDGMPDRFRRLTGRAETQAPQSSYEVISLDDSDDEVDAGTTATAPPIAGNQHTAEPVSVNGASSANGTSSANETSSMTAIATPADAPTGDSTDEDDMTTIMRVYHGKNGGDHSNFDGNSAQHASNGVESEVFPNGSSAFALESYPETNGSTDTNGLKDSLWSGDSILFPASQDAVSSPMGESFPFDNTRHTSIVSWSSSRRSSSAFPPAGMDSSLTSISGSVLDLPSLTGTERSSSPGAIRSGQMARNRLSTPPGNPSNFPFKAPTAVPNIPVGPTDLSNNQRSQSTPQLLTRPMLNHSRSFVTSGALPPIPREGVPSTAQSQVNLRLNTPKSRRSSQATDHEDEPPRKLPPWRNVRPVADVQPAVSHDDDMVIDLTLSDDE